MNVFNSVALTTNGAVAISFSKINSSASKETSPRASFVLPQEMQTDLNVAFWGGDNLYPQNVTEQISTCGVALSALDFKAKMLYGHGLAYGKITKIDKNGYEVFEPAQPGDYPEIDKWFKANDNFTRFYLEFNQDWVQFGNCFPELIFSKDRKTIAKIVHQESSDCRFAQMNDNGVIDTVLFSKYWADVSTQYVKAHKEDKLKARKKDNQKMPKEKVDNKIVKELRALDMYDSYNDLINVVASSKHNSVILPVNYPSTGKTYYQQPGWHSLLLSGWIEIASKIPELLQTLYTKSFNIKYHIEVPESYFKNKVDNWDQLDEATKLSHKQELVKTMDEFLSSSTVNQKNLITFFEIDPNTKKDFGGIKITEIKNMSSVDKELFLSSAANQEILFALQINPNMIGAGAPGGAYTGGAGSGSDIREAFLVYNSIIHPEQQLILEPIKLAARFNKFPEEVVFRFKKIVLTTLDQNTGSKQVT